MAAPTLSRHLPLPLGEVAEHSEDGEGIPQSPEACRISCKAIVGVGKGGDCFGFCCHRRGGHWPPGPGAAEIRGRPMAAPTLSRHLPLPLGEVARRKAGRRERLIPGLPQGKPSSTAPQVLFHPPRAGYHLLPARRYFDPASATCAPKRMKREAFRTFQLFPPGSRKARGKAEKKSAHAPAWAESVSAASPAPFRSAT